MRSGDLTERSGGEACLNTEEVRVIERVEHLCSELQFHVFLDCEELG